MGVPSGHTIPPVFLYAFGWGTGWIRRGFQDNNK